MIEGIPVNTDARLEKEVDIVRTKTIRLQFFPNK